MVIQHYLLQVVKEIGGKSNWSEIAKQFENRSEFGVRDKYLKMTGQKR